VDVPAPSIVAVEPAPVPVPVQYYTLDEAFSILRQALAAHYDQADNVPAYLQTQETQMLFDNGNHATSWQHLVLLLEQGLGVSLRQG
jgi:hypothetical protein